MATRKILHIIIVFFLLANFGLSGAGTNCLCAADSPSMHETGIPDLCGVECCVGIPFVDDPMMNTGEPAGCCDGGGGTCPCCIEKNNAKTDMALSAVPNFYQGSQYFLAAQCGEKAGTTGANTPTRRHRGSVAPRSSPIYLEVLSFLC